MNGEVIGMSRVLDKEKTIKYLQRVADQHDRQLTPICGGFWAPLVDDCPNCMDEMGHGFKKQFAETLIAKIKLGDLDG